MTNNLFDFLRMGGTTNTPPVRHRMRSVLLVLGFLLGSMSVWGATITFSELGLANGTQYTDPFEFDDSNITVTFAGGANDGKYYDTGTGIRTYGGGSLTIAAASGTITSATLTFSGASYAPASNDIVDVGVLTSGAETTWTGSASSFTLTRPSGSGHWRLQRISVTYTTGGSDPVAVTGVSLDEDAIALEVGEKQTLTATVSPNDATNKNVTWESDDEDVATVVNGLVTAVGAGDATITAKTDDGDFTATCDVTVTAAETPTLTFDFSAQGYENGVQYTSIDGDANITISFGDGANDGKYYNTGTAIRIYGGGHMTIAGGEGVTISKIVLEFGAGDGSNAISTDVGTYDNGQWTGSAQTVTFTAGGTSGHRRIMKVKVFYEVAAITVAKPTISGETPFLSSTSVSISHADADHIYYTTNGDAPTTSSTEYTAPFSLTNTATVKAIAVKGSDVSSVAEKTFTKVTIMTVAEARTAIDNGGDLSNKYVAGIISQIDEYNSTYHSITYWISDDGTTTDQLQVYSGLAGIALGGANFTAKEDLLVGDDVTVNGTLKKYNSIYEFDKNNAIVICKLKARLAWGAASFDADLNASNTFPVLTNASGVTVAYSSTNTDAATIDPSTGEITLVAVGTTNIKATFAGDENYKANEVSYTLNVANSMVHATISFNVDGGEAIADMTDQHELPNPLPVATKAGKNFGGWFTDVDKTIAAVAGDAITSDVVLYVKWLDPYTVAEAKAVIDATPAGTENQYVAGIISQVDNYNNTYKSITYWISADGTTTDQLEVYSGKGLSSADFSAKEDLQVGDEVVVAGTLKKYNDIYEFDKNNYLYSFNRPAVPTYSITYEENGANEDIADEAAATNLPDPLPTVTKADKAFGGWFTTSTFDPGTEAVAGAALTDDVILYAKWVDVSIWALTYGSNVTVGTDKVVINTVEYAAKKTGTNSAFGSTTIEVPTGTTTLHFHAAGWGADAVVNLEVKKGETLLNTFALTKDAGVKSNSPFTLEGTPYLQYYSVALSEITEPTTITFEAKNDGGKRFVLYGVNQEGGTVPATITANPMSVSFGSVEQNASVTAKTINVTLTNVAAATVTLAEDDAFSIDQTSLTENGTITVTPNTTTVGTYAATVTISDDANAADAVVVNVSMTVTEPEVNDNVTGTWTLVTDAATLAAGKKVIIAQYVDADGEIYTMGKQNTNNRAQVESTVAGATLTPATGTKVLTLVDAGEGKFAIQASNGNYLSAAGTGTSNHLKEAANYDNDNEKWTITIASDQAKIQAASSNRNTIRYNSGSSIFSCYAEDGQAAVALYMLEETTPPTPVLTDVRDGLTPGNYYTICYPKAMKNIQGATLWSFIGKDADFAYLLEETATTIEAGKPYILYATASTVRAELEGEDAAAGTNGAIHGTLVAMNQDALNAAATTAGHDLYLVIGNQLRQATGDALTVGNSLPANRAYVILDVIPDGKPASAPGRNVRSMPMHKNAATGMDELNASEAPRKMIIDGKMYIFRGEKMYNANGQLVK